jgi:putative chitinase
MIQLASLVAAGIGPTQARLFEAPLAAACLRFGIDTPLRQAAFVSQCAHESRLLTALEEGLFYRDPARICRIFRSTVPSVAVAQALACNPKLLANHVYANRNGNRDQASGDGWRYRGRGLIQLTGRANYTRAAAGLDRPYVDDPDLLLGPADACLTAAWFWDAHGLNALADASRIDDITRAINGPGMAGAAERRQLFAATLAAFQPPIAARSRAARSETTPAAPTRRRAPAKSPAMSTPARKVAAKKRAAPPTQRAGAVAKHKAPPKPRAGARSRSAAKTG